MLGQDLSPVGSRFNAAPSGNHADCDDLELHPTATRSILEATHLVPGVVDARSDHGVSLSAMTAMSALLR
jgi:hypothetical protein